VAADLEGAGSRFRAQGDGEHEKLCPLAEVDEEALIWGSAFLCMFLLCWTFLAKYGVTCIFLPCDWAVYYILEVGYKSEAFGPCFMILWLSYVQVDGKTCYKHGVVLGHINMAILNT